MTRGFYMQRVAPNNPIGYFLWAGLLAFVFGLAGCASGPHANPHDPLEPFNRGVYQFNDAVDVAVIKPVAIAYQDVVPQPVRLGVGNFFNNLQDAWSFVNNTLQFKGQAAADSLARFGVNTFIGLGGVLDVASDFNIERHTNDFGHTLGSWGVGPGPYVVIPIFGPSTVRDTLARVVDIKGDLSALVSNVPLRNTATAVRLVDRRAVLLQATSMLEEAALDKYTFTRDSYLQRRRSVIYDGNPPEEDVTEPEPAQ
jgi:phospholipid-binding lipoprotein MlaA